jgi:hypothetical protein
MLEADAHRVRRAGLGAAWVVLGTLIVTAGAVAAPPHGTRPGGEPPPLARRYHEGDTLRFHMDATNQDRRHTVRYHADATGIVRRDSLGHWYEDFEWSNLVRDDVPVALTAGSPAVRQRLTLSPDYMLPPDLSRTDPRLVGPVLDLMTFYVDLRLAARLPVLRHPGDHARFPGQGTNSWADGRVVTLGEDAIDFDITLGAIDRKRNVETVVVRHVPPDSSRLKLPAAWMSAPVAGTPNNWVEVSDGGDGKKSAAVGSESFEVTLQVALDDGRLLSASMNNPVEVLERTCADSALTQCGEPVRSRILRQITLR